MEGSLNFEGLPFDINDSIEENIKVIEKFIKTSDRKPDTVAQMEMCREYLSRYLISCVNYEDMKLVLEATNKIDRMITSSHKSMAKQSSIHGAYIFWRDSIDLPKRKLVLKENKSENVLLLSITGILGVLFLLTFFFVRPAICIAVLIINLLWCFELFLYVKRRRLAPTYLMKFLLRLLNKNVSKERYDRAMIWKTELLSHKNNEKLSAVLRQMINCKGFNSNDVRLIEQVYENVVELDRN